MKKMREETERGRVTQEGPWLCLRRLAPEHSHELSAFETRIFRHGWQAEQMEEALSSPQTHWGFGLFLEKEPVHGEGNDEDKREHSGGHAGGMCAYILMDSALDECEIGNIAVREDLRGKGLGGKLLDRALQEARDRHIKACFLEVATQNAVARSLYASRGFVEVGLRKGYYPKTSDDALIMRLEL